MDCLDLLARPLVSRFRQRADVWLGSWIDHQCRYRSGRSISEGDCTAKATADVAFCRGYSPHSVDTLVHTSARRRWFSHSGSLEEGKGRREGSPPRGTTATLARCRRASTGC